MLRRQPAPLCRPKRKKSQLLSMKFRPFVRRYAQTKKASRSIAPRRREGADLSNCLRAGTLSNADDIAVLSVDVDGVDGAGNSFDPDLIIVLETIGAL